MMIGIIVHDGQVARRVFCLHPGGEAGTKWGIRC